MSYRTLKIFTVLIPTILIGGFEFIRHSVLIHYLSMETGNILLTILTFIISYLFATWMFKTIKVKNQRITEERELMAIYEERERLAKELHDNIAQSIFLLKVDLKKEKLAEAGAVVNSIDTNLRQAIFNLRIKPKEYCPFAKRVDNWVNEWNLISGVETTINIDIEADYFSQSEEILLFGIIQEAFTNIRKHANASNVELDLETEKESWELMIKDDGSGFSVNKIQSHHYGLAMIEERVNKLGAFLDIISGDNMGTKLVVKGVKIR